MKECREESKELSAVTAVEIKNAAAWNPDR